MDPSILLQNLQNQTGTVQQSGVEVKVRKAQAPHMQRMKVDKNGNTYFTSKHKETAFYRLTKLVDNPLDIWVNKNSWNQLLLVFIFVFVFLVFPLIIPALIIYLVIYSLGEFTLTFNDQTKCVVKKGPGSFSIPYDKAKDFVVEEWVWYQEYKGGRKAPQTGGIILMELDSGQTLHVGTSLASSRAQSVAKSLKEVLYKRKGININPVDNAQPKRDPNAQVQQIANLQKQQQSNCVQQ